VQIHYFVSWKAILGENEMNKKKEKLFWELSEDVSL